MSRRTDHIQRRRIAHTKRRRAGIVDQSAWSNSEGPQMSAKAVKATRSLTARKP